MNTPTHILVAYALLSKNKSEEHISDKKIRFNNWAVIAGGLLPDLSIFIFFVWARLFTDANFQKIWGELYWTEPWQTLSAISNSFPLMVLLLLFAWWKKSQILMVLSLAMLAHVGLDLPFHADDAHKHFWPLTDIRIHSPFSYWDVDHHAEWIRYLECSILIIAALIVINRFKSLWIRLLALSPVIVHISFLIFFAVRS